jgi:hypothetical protein
MAQGNIWRSMWEQEAEVNVPKPRDWGAAGYGPVAGVMAGLTDILPVMAQQKASTQLMERLNAEMNDVTKRLSLEIKHNGRPSPETVMRLHQLGAVAEPLKMLYDYAEQGRLSEKELREYQMKALEAMEKIAANPTQEITEGAYIPEFSEVRAGAIEPIAQEAGIPYSRERMGEGIRRATEYSEEKREQMVGESNQEYFNKIMTRINEMVVTPYRGMLEKFIMAGTSIDEETIREVGRQVGSVISNTEWEWIKKNGYEPDALFDPVRLFALPAATLTATAKKEYWDALNASMRASTEKKPAEEKPLWTISTENVERRNTVSFFTKAEATRDNITGLPVLMELDEAGNMREITIDYAGLLTVIRRGDQLGYGTGQNFDWAKAIEHMKNAMKSFQARLAAPMRGIPQEYLSTTLPLALKDAGVTEVPKQFEADIRSVLGNYADNFFGTMGLRQPQITAPAQTEFIPPETGTEITPQGPAPTRAGVLDSEYGNMEVMHPQTFQVVWDIVQKFPFSKEEIEQEIIAVETNRERYKNTLMGDFPGHDPNALYAAYLAALRRKLGQ